MEDDDEVNHVRLCRDEVDLIRTALVYWMERLDLADSGTKDFHAATSHKRASRYVRERIVRLDRRLEAVWPTGDGP